MKYSIKIKMNNNNWQSNLNQWAINNPIPDLESLKNNHYKDFDGYLGLPDDTNEFENITNLVLPLGSDFKGELPKELGNLKALTELSIFARNLKEIPIEVFQLPNLKKLVLTLYYTYKVNDKNLKILIDNGCQEIRINALHMSTKYTHTIKDEAIIDYLLVNKLYMTSISFGIHPEDLYNITKKIAFENEEMAQYMLQFLDSKFNLGFDAFISAKNMDEKEINRILDFIEAEYEMSDDIEKYVEMLLLVGFSIVESFPFKALELFDNINKTYEMVGSLPIETLDLSVDIVCRIAKDDLAQALELVDTIIDVDYYKLEALQKINALYDNQEVKEMMDRARDEIAKYDEEYFDN